MSDKKWSLKYVEQALCFHGPPMQKIWDNERGADDLQRIGLPAQTDYAIYQQRQRFFTFQDRAKRLKLHQFFARKAKELYDADLKLYANVPDEKQMEKVATSYATIPPYENYVCDPNDKDRKWHTLLESLKPGDIVYGVVSKTTTASMLFIKPLCTMPPIVRYLNHLPLKGVVCSQDLGNLPRDKTSLIHQFVCCEIVRVSADVDRIFLGFNGEHKKDPNVVLGLLENRDSLPLYYHKATANALEKYENCLKNAKEFLNPNYEVLYKMNGLDMNSQIFSMMNALQQRFPPHEMAKELRKTQAHKWAFRSVADGIELFKNGKHLEAFQCLNKALSIDPYNVEGLVARGALFANRGSFHKAIDDFGNALKLDQFHANARKYMGETLIALGRSLEEERRLDEAAKAYKDCLELIPHHVQAMGCLEALNQRLTGSLLSTDFLDNLLSITATVGKSANNVAEKSSSNEESSSDSDDSIESVSKNSSSKLPKASSLSPLSKRMAMHSAYLRGDNAGSSMPLNDAPPPLAVSMAASAAGYEKSLFSADSIADANDFRLDDDDTQTRVLKLLEEASAHKKHKKKKSKKSKKSKKDESTKKSKKITTKDKAADDFDVPTLNLEQSLFQSNYLLETFKNIGNDNFQQKINKDINSYEHKIAELRKREQLIRQSLTTTTGNKAAAAAPPHDDESPPPPPMISKMPTANNISKANNKNSAAANFSKMHIMTPSTSSYLSNADSGGGSNGGVADHANKFSFQIKKPVKVDVFGMVRLATPLKQERSPSIERRVREDEDERTKRHGRRSRTRSNERQRERRHQRRSRTRSRSRSRSRRSHSKRSRSRRSRSRRSRSLSSSQRRRRNRRHSHSRSKSRSPSRFRSRSRRDKHSPFLRRSSHSRSRSRSKTSRFSDSRPPKSVFPNRVWQRPGLGQAAAAPPKASDQKWLHDKFEEINSDPAPVAKKEDGPSIEEIDEIINRAQRERKAEIISRDKDILKRPNNARF